MKNKKISVITGVVIVLISIYAYLISGEKIDDKKAIWLVESPIAHRGLRNGDIPENSIKSFKKAMEKNYTIELDVQLTKDKKLVVFHDDNLKRMTNCDKKVKDVNYQDLKKLRLENTDEKIPTLKEVINLVDNKVPLLIEIKNSDDVKSVCEATYNEMKNYKGRYAIQSFNPFALEYFKKKDEKILRGQLSGTLKKDADNLKLYEKFLLKNLMLNFKSKPNFICYELDGINNLSVRLLQGRNYPIISWTIENEEDMKKAYEKTDNIIFDNIEP